MAKVGFVGLGIMGEPMCRNLLAKGHDVTVFNRTPAKMGSLVAAGANAATSLAGFIRAWNSPGSGMSDTHRPVFWLAGQRVMPAFL